MKTKRVGELLRDERESRRLTIQQVSQFTKIRQEYIEALEHARFDQLPPSPYVRGYVRTICDTLGLESEPVIALLRRDYTEASNGKLQPTLLWKKRRPKQFAGVLGWSILLISALFVTTTLYLGMQWYSSIQPPFLQVTAPEPFAVLTSPTVITGFTEPEAVVVINGQPASLKPDGSFSHEIELAMQGLLTIQVEAKDAVGKRTVRDIPVRVIAEGESVGQ